MKLFVVLLAKLPELTYYCHMPTTTRLNGPTLRVIRELKGVKHGQFARRVELNPGYLTKLENGSRQPSPEVLRKLADALGVPLEVISYPTTATAGVAA